MRRYGLRDDQWDRIAGLLPGRIDHVGATARDNRLFVEAVLYRYRAGMPWRDIPERFGDASGLDAWIASAGDSDLGGLATGVTRDKAAVAAAITEPWSTSPVEGHINRLKAIKRSMYGRAGYQTLRARMLAA